MARFQADSLDLSRLPSPTLVEVDYEKALAARLVDLKARYAAIGIDYDETELELDSGVILEEVDAGREIIALQAINDAGKSNMLAFAKGAALDQLAALLGVVRLQTGVDGIGEPIFETDERLRRRVQLAPEAFATAGSEGAYVFHALTAVPALADATAVNPERGEIVITVMGGNENPSTTTPQVDAVREYIFREDIKVATDIVTVQGAGVITVDLEADMVLYRGPDSDAVLKDAKTALEGFLKQNKRLGRDLRLGAWLGRLHRDTVYGVVPKSPLADIPATRAQVIWVRSIKLNVVGIDE